MEYGELRRRRRREIWALANTLWAWGRLVPKPLAILSREGRTILVLERPEEARVLSEIGDAGAAGGALRVLLDRLAAVAEIDFSLPPDAIALGKEGGSPPRAMLLAPDRVRLRGAHAAVLPGYHLNKRHWNTVIIDGSLADDTVRDMIEDSYDLVVSKLPRARRRALGWRGDT